MTKQKSGFFRTMAEVKAANKSIGNHWFDQKTMQFFDSKVESRLHAGRYFVYSNQFHGSDGSVVSSPRTYHIARVGPDGSVDKVCIDGQALEYANKDNAKLAMKLLAQGE